MTQTIIKMESLSIEQLFGKGAYQDENVLVINKASLLRLSPTITNSAESLLVGILITALENFQGIITDENNQSITDENNQPITYDNSESFELIKLIGWKPFFFAINTQLYIKNQIIVFSYVKNQ